MAKSVVRFLQSFMPLTRLRMAEFLQVEMDRPQETHMWETFGESIYQVKSGSSPNYEWARQASICSKLCIAVEQSAQDNCKPIDVKGWF